MPVPFKLPLPYTVLFVVGGLGCFAVKALLGDTWASDVAADLLGLFGAVLLGAAGLDAAGPRLLKTLWIRQTHGIVQGYYQVAVDEIATIGVGCVDLARSALAPRDDFGLHNGGPSAWPVLRQRIAEGRRELPGLDDQEAAEILSEEPRIQEDEEAEAQRYADVFAVRGLVDENEGLARNLEESARRLAPAMLTHVEPCASALEAIGRYRADYANPLLSASRRHRGQGPRTGARFAGRAGQPSVRRVDRFEQRGAVSNPFLTQRRR